jgi:aminoglycoside phosphotransferase (APT) family kinase protein
VRVPRPVVYVEAIEGGEACVWERLVGERLGGGIVRGAGPEGLVGVLDWEFVHLDEPVRDLAFSMVRAWRFGVPEKRLGGIGDVDPFVERYNELTGLDVRPEELDYWELAGNVAWAIGCLTQAQRHLSGRDRSVELAVLGRLGAAVEYEICCLLEKVDA